MDHSSYKSDKNKTIKHPPTQIILFLGALIFLGMMLGSGVILLISNIQGIDFQETMSQFNKESTLVVRNYMRGSLLTNHLLSFLIPAWLTGYVFYRHLWPKELGIRLAPPARQLGLGVLLTICSFPLAQLAFSANRWLVQQVGFLESMIVKESASENLMEGLLVMPSAFEMAFSLMVMALIPAIGEEMVFRGLLQKQLQRMMTNPYAAILVTAIVFSLAHFQVQRFLAIFLLGLILGLIYFWTRNLWIPIAGHFVFNGTQVLAAFANQDNLDQLNVNEDIQLPFAAIAFSIIAVFYIGKKMIDDDHSASADKNSTK